MDLKKIWDSINIALSIPREYSDYYWGVLERRYGESHRRYHTLEHIRTMFASFQIDIRGMTDLQFAIFFHDIVYNITAKDNEEKSAIAAFEYLHTYNSSIAERVDESIRATAEHIYTGTDRTTLLLIDSDLSILGAPPALYRLYMKQIREEYGHIGTDEFMKGRLEFLKSFYTRKNIFNTAEFIPLERQGRGNILAEISEIEVYIKGMSGAD